MNNKTFLEKLSIGCAAIDKLLGGGLERGIVTAIYGEAGSGKTAFALQAAIACIKRGQKTIFIDTECGFSPERFLQIFSKKEALAKIILLEPKEFSAQSSALQKLKPLVAKEKAGLVVIDSLVALYRLEMNNETAADVNKELARQLAILMQLAAENKIPVLITNQVYSSFKSTSRSRQLEMVAGDIPKYLCKCIIRLEKIGRGKRRAILEKHRSIAEGKTAEFEIRNEGLVSKRRIF